MPRLPKAGAWCRGRLAAGVCWGCLEGEVVVGGAYGGVLSEVSEADCGRDDEEEGGDAGEDCEGLGEVLRLFHLGDEGWEQDL